ncbi:MAG: ATP-binding protein [Pseudomonadota bacterium]
MLTLLRKAYGEEAELIISSQKQGWVEFSIRHLILLVLNVTAIQMFDVIFPAYWLVAYTCAGLGTRWAISRLALSRSFAIYLAVIGFYTARMICYRLMVLYLWFHPEPAAQFPALCMIMAGILFSVSQSTQIRSHSVVQGAGDSLALLVIALDFLWVVPATAESILAGFCAIGVIVYHAASLQEMQRNRKASQNLEERIRQSQKMEAVGKLTGGVAHDFNNILTVVMGNLDLYPEVKSEAERADLVKKAHEAAERASILTSQLLAFSRQSPLQIKRVPTDQFLHDLYDLAIRVLPATITLDLRIDDEISAMEVDQNQLEVALLNLIINARDAMSEGGRLQLIALPYKAPNNPKRYVQLDLIDEGDGIPAENIDRVVEPFFTTKPVGQGSGLGLSMVKGFAEQSGGRLMINSAKGSGTRVCLLIPAAAET